MKVHLETYELLIAVSVGARRQISALKKGLESGHGFTGDPWGIHIEGAAGELAVAKALGVYWNGSVDTFKTGGDVGKWQIRTRSRHDYDLLVRPGDRANDVFILVTGQAPDFWVRGWCLGGDAMRECYLKEYGGRPPAYFVPAKHLKPLETLKQ